MKILIGIPTLNGPDRLERVLGSVHKHTNTSLGDVVVFVSDDASTPENLRLNIGTVREHGVELIKSEHRLGVSQQWNRLVRHVPDADICVLLNDDVEVVEDWLDVLVFSLERNPSLGMLSLRSETGVIGQDQPPRPRLDYNEARLMTGGGSLVSSGGACFAFRRADWEAVGWFDERYFCFYEEVDFGAALSTQFGKTSAFASYPVIYHMGGATTTSLNPSQYLEESRAKFWEKWGKTMDQLRAEMIARPQPPLIEWNTSWKVSRLP